MRRCHPSSYQQREEGSRANPSEQQQVELHRQRQPAKHRIGRGAAGDAGLGGGACLADRLRVGLGGAERPGKPPRRPARHRALGHAHQDVLDEPADERCVVADAADPESGGAGDLLELRDVAKRVQVIRFAKVFLAQVDESPSIELPRHRVDAPQPDGDAARSSGRACRRTARRRAPARARPPPACRAAPPARDARARRARTPS